MAAATAIRLAPAAAGATRQGNPMTPNTTRSPFRVALLLEEGFPTEPLRGLITAFGWSWHIILADDLDESPATLWDLIIIATDGHSIPVAPICARVSRDARQRILIISRDRTPQSIADALNAGADDYIIAPFDPDECRARMKALIFRSGDPLRSHRHVLWTEPLSRTIGIGERYVSLSPREWNLIVTLLEAEQEPVEPLRLGQRVWGTRGQPSTLASTVSRLRQKLRAHHLDGI
ncbi:MAG: response regulator transcription factor, partial [Vicinamibacterales bacterium]